MAHGIYRFLWELQFADETETADSATEVSAEARALRSPESGEKRRSPRRRCMGFLVPLIYLGITIERKLGCMTRY